MKQNVLLGWHQLKAAKLLGPLKMLLLLLLLVDVGEGVGWALTASMGGGRPSPDPPLAMKNGFLMTMPPLELARPATRKKHKYVIYNTTSCFWINQV